MCTIVCIYGKPLLGLSKHVSDSHELVQVIAQLSN